MPARNGPEIFLFLDDTITFSQVGIDASHPTLSGNYWGTAASVERVLLSLKVIADS